MKKFTQAIGLILITILFIKCTSDNNPENIDTALVTQLQGRWKLTESYTNSPATSTPIANGYEIQFNNDGTFSSNEENGYMRGTYTVLNNPDKNLRLTFIKQWEAKLVYQYITAITADNLTIQASTNEPVTDGLASNAGFTLTRIP